MPKKFYEINLRLKRLDKYKHSSLVCLCICDNEKVLKHWLLFVSEAFGKIS
jgi:hypothetical protein